MNSDGFCVPLTKHEFDDAERSILENLNKNIERNILNLTQNFLNNSKNQFMDSDHSGKTQFSLEKNLLR